ncbi:MAG: FAD-dependent oxidoreductase [Polyangiaceae bacterium]
MARTRYLIIGDGGAGITAAETIRAEDSAASIGILTDDPNPAYFRAALTNFLLGELREDQIWAVPPDYYEAAHIHRIFTRVVGVDTSQHRVHLSNGTSEAYDQLLLASGARARHPDFPGSQLPGVMTMRTVQDVRGVLDAVRTGRVRHAVVLGGGALGLEWAHGMLEHGVKVTLLEFAPRLLPRSLDPVASDLLAARLRRAGVEVHLGDAVEQAHAGPDGFLARVSTKQGRILEVQMVAAAIGVIPNSEFLKDSGVKLHERGAIPVNERMQTNVPNVYAAGDCALFNGQALALWEPARAQGRIAGLNMCGVDASYRVGEHYFATRLFDLDFAAVGSVQDQAGGEDLIDFPRGTGSISYRRLVIKQGKLVGALMVGERNARVRQTGRAYKRLVDLGVDVSEVKHKLLAPGFDVKGFIEQNKLVHKESGASIPPPGGAPGYRATMTLAATSLSPPKQASENQRAKRTLASLGEVAQRVAEEVTQLQAEPASAGAQLSIGLRAATSAMPVFSSETRGLGASLYLDTPNGPGQRWQVPQEPMNIGTDSTCEVKLDAAGVSVVHAQVVQYGEKLYLRDLGSHSGTRVNGQPLTQVHTLGHGDRIEIGTTCLVLDCARLPQTAAPAQAAPVSRAGQPQRAPRLEFRSGHSFGLSVALGSHPVTIGSDPSCHFRVADPSVAPQHLGLRYVNGRAYVMDLGQAGTWVTGQRLIPRQEVALAEGSELRLGEVLAVYTEQPLASQGSLLDGSAQLSVIAGQGLGRAVRVGERLYVGNHTECGLVLSDPGVPSVALEITRHQGNFFVRDPSGSGGSSKAGVPIGAQAIPIAHQEVLMVGGAMLRFEEVP